MDFNKLNQILDKGSTEDLNVFCQEHSLEIRDGKIFHTNPAVVEQSIAFWDKRQLVKKINLNS
jgi:hypothetical protein